MLKAIKRLIAFFLFMACCLNSYGQLFFYVQSKLHTADNKLLAYQILFTYSEIGMAGTASARITFKDPVTGKNRLVKQSYVDDDFPDYSSEDSITYMVPFGMAYNEDDTPAKDFVTPKFEFHKSATITYLGDAKVKVYYSYNNQQWFLPESGSVQPKSNADLMKQKVLVKQFYNENEAFYKSLFNIKTPKLTAAEAGRKIFLLAIAATDDPQIGITTQIDLQNIKNTFVTNAYNWRVGFQYKEISGSNFTKKAVNDAIDHLKPSPRDIVVVFYSGHGFRYTGDESQFPRMALVANPDQTPDTSNIGVEDLYNRILKKGARVNIVLADCCNENYGAAPPIAPVPQVAGASLGTPPTLNLDNFRALFLPLRTLNVLACAAEKNQLASGNINLGGFFTNFVTTGLNTSLYGDPMLGQTSWTMILNNAKEYTRRQALTAPCKDGPCIGGRSLQQPEFKVSALQISAKLH